MRIVLDTNVVLDLVVFQDAGVEPLRRAIESGGVALITSTECLEELRRVLPYPELNLDPAAQASAYAWFESRIEVLDVPASPPLLPRCRDADDQKFLALAWASGAAHLVTKDKALLELAPRIARLGRFALTEPHVLSELLHPT